MGYPSDETFEEARRSPGPRAQRPKPVLDFNHLRQVNVARCNSGAFGHSLNDWSPVDWTNALAGEAGEACNESKKLKRQDTRRDSSVSVEERTRRLAEELADVVIYADLAAARLGVDLGEAIRTKFNKTSAEQASPHVL